MDLIINFTATGMIPTKEMTPYVPITVDEIVEDVHRAMDIGITMVHLHARDRSTGKPTYGAEVYAGIIAIYIGTNGKMDEVSAVMGLTSLESLDGFIAVNRRNYRHYQRELARTPGIRMVAHDKSEKRNYQYIVLETDEVRTKVSRDQLVDILHAENVIARRYFYPGCHRMEPYRSYFPHAGLLLPETERLVERVLALPTGTAVGPDEINRICQIIRTVIAHGEEVRERLRRT